MAEYSNRPKKHDPTKMVRGALTEEEIHSSAKAYLRGNLAVFDDGLRENWESAYGYSKGEQPEANNATNSEVISTDVSDTIEWVLPSILQPLIETPDVVRFDPVTPDDVEQAAMESDYVHSVFMKQCDGFVKLYNHIKDALLLKNAIFFTYWDNGYRHQKEPYKDLNEFELADLLFPEDGSKVRILEKTEREVPIIDVETGIPLAELRALMAQEAPQMPQGPTPDSPAPMPTPQPPGGPGSLQQAPGTPSRGVPISKPKQALTLTRRSSLPDMAPPSGAPGALGPQPGAPMPPPAPPEGPTTEKRYDVVVRRFWPRGQARVENCVPECFMVDSMHGSVTLDDATWCSYAMRKRRSELSSEGYPDDLIDEIPKSSRWRWDTGVRWAREDVEHEQNQATGGENETEDPSQDQFEIHRVYMRLDCDGDGIEEEYLIILGGDEGQVMLDYYEVPENPFSASTPFIAAHKFYGHSLYDKLKQLADHKTKVLRMLEDNLDLVNNPPKKALRGAAVLQDLYVREAGGIWRVDDMNAVQTIPIEPLDQKSAFLLEYFDKQRAERSGVDPNAQAITNAMPEESMNHAMERLLSQKEQLVALMIRVFAETGIKNMFLKLRGALMRNLDKDQTVQLRNKWTKINPGSWVERTTTTVVVGLGTGDRLRKAQALSAVMEQQLKVLETGQEGILVSPERIAYTAGELIRAQRLGDPDDFFLSPAFLADDPRNAETPRGKEMLRAQQSRKQKQQAEMQKEQMKVKQQQMTAQMNAQQQDKLIQAQLSIAKLQEETKRMKAQMEAQGDQKQLLFDIKELMENLKLEYTKIGKSFQMDQARLGLDTAKGGLEEERLRIENKKADNQAARQKPKPDESEEGGEE